MRRPQVDYESHATALDDNGVGALLVAACLGPAPEHALISPLALNGLRASEATGANIRRWAGVATAPWAKVVGRDRPAGTAHCAGHRPGHR